LQIAGLGILVDQEAPAWHPQALAAARCWQWCGGWDPQRALLFAAMRGVADVELLLDLMTLIRDWEPQHGG
jgi:hypothetical protein